VTSPRKPGFVLPVAVTLTVLLGLYVGAYYWMVQPLGRRVSGDPWLIATPFYGPESELYHLGHTPWNDRLRPLFTPMHWLDRRIRPHVWEPSLTQEDIDIVRDPAQR
jgi:hypothetical protein